MAKAAVATLDAVRTAVIESEVIDFEAAGKLVAELGPILQRLGEGGGNPAADDYVVKGIDSVIHIYKLMDGGLGSVVDPAELSQIGAQLSQLGAQLQGSD